MNAFDAICTLSGMTTEKNEIVALQSLIDSGMAWRLEGSVGRAAMSAIEAGDCILPTCWKDGKTRPLNDKTMKQHADKLKPVMRDAFDNVIPYREMLKPGTKGTPSYAAARKHRP